MVYYQYKEMSPGKYIPSEELQISNNYKFWLKSTISISF